MFASSVWRAVWPKYVRDVAVPSGFARPWWEVCLRGAVPLGSAKHAGVNAACAGEGDRWLSHVICVLLVCGQTVWPKYVRDVAVPMGFARPWWEVRLRGAVLVGSAKHAGVNAARRW